LLQEQKVGIFAENRRSCADITCSIAQPHFRATFDRPRPRFAAACSALVDRARQR
jgi:hypothetical protein